MPQSYNRVELIGRLGRDPELKHTDDGKPFARFSLATDRPVRGGETETDWHDVVCWEKQAEFASAYLSKGRLVFVAGRLTYRTWTGKDGQQRRGVEVRASEVLPLDRRPEATSPEAHAVSAPTDLYGHDTPF